LKPSTRLRTASSGCWARRVGKGDLGFPSLRLPVRHAMRQVCWPQ
jgi:hypothetical protein